MSVGHVPILKAKSGEFDALRNTRGAVAKKIRPLFEIGRITESIAGTKYMKQSKTPTITYLDRVADGIFAAWGKRPAMVDAYQWAPNKVTENGMLVIGYMIDRLSGLGMPIIPVVGYDRWEDKTYRLGVKGISPPIDGHYCLRMDAQAIEDSAEPELLNEKVSEIISELSLVPSQCSVLIDFGDVTNIPIEKLIDQSSNLIEQMNEVGFVKFITAGCSIPKSVNLAVKDQDAASMVIRREMLLWKALRDQFENVEIVYGDYCLRGPTANDDIRSKYINGKIRHTVDQQIFVVRGHPFVNDGGAEQMWDLAKKLVKSPHYLGPEFSWGDSRIKACSQEEFVGSPTNWIAIDTNHHLAYVMHEVGEFERRKVPVKAFV